MKASRLSKLKNAIRTVNSLRQKAGNTVSYAQARHIPMKLAGGVSMADAERIMTGLNAVNYSRKNWFRLEVSSKLTSPEVAQMIGDCTTSVEFGLGGSVSSERRMIGGLRSDAVTGREPVDLRIVCRDVDRGTIKAWFHAHAELCASRDGTVGLPGDYAITITIEHMPGSGQYATTLKVRPVSLDVSLDRGDGSLEELHMQFTEIDNWA